MNKHDREQIQSIDLTFTPTSSPVVKEKIYSTHKQPSAKGKREFFLLFALLLTSTLLAPFITLGLVTLF